MDDLAVINFPSLYKVLMGFFICALITAASVFVALLGFGYCIGIDWIKSSEPKKGLPLLLAGVLIYLLTFPFGAWIWREDLRAITPQWLFPNLLVLLFGTTQIFVTVVWRIYSRISNY